MTFFPQIYYCLEESISTFVYFLWVIEVWTFKTTKDLDLKKWDGKQQTTQAIGAL